jgi:hypothetical protein
MLNFYQEKNVGHKFSPKEMSFGIVYEKEIGMFLNGSFSNSNYTKR